MMKKKHLPLLVILLLLISYSLSKTDDQPSQKELGVDTDTYKQVVNIKNDYFNKYIKICGDTAYYINSIRELAADDYDKVFIINQIKKPHTTYENNVSDLDKLNGVTFNGGFSVAGSPAKSGKIVDKSYIANSSDSHLSRQFPTNHPASGYFLKNTNLKSINNPKIYWKEDWTNSASINYNFMIKKGNIMPFRSLFEGIVLEEIPYSCEQIREYSQGSN